MPPQKIQHSPAFIEYLKKKQEILISYVHYILVTYLQCLTKYKL